MNIYFETFGIFFKIGAFTIGGGYAMVPLIENEIVTKRKWITQDDFINLLAISQSAPGILAVNISIFIGYKLKGIPGSIITALGTILPSFIIILAIALFFPQLSGQCDRRTDLQRNPPRSSCSDCCAYIQHGKVSTYQPLQHLDSCGLRITDLATGLLSYLDYHHSRSRRILVGEA